MRDAEAFSGRFAKDLRKRMTDAEIILWSYIPRRALNGARIRRQHPIGPYIADFACIGAKLGIEVDGATHWSDEQLEHDRRRASFLESQCLHVLRVTNTDAFNNLDGVWRTIAELITPPAASRPPPPHAGEEL